VNLASDSDRTFSEGNAHDVKVPEKGTSSPPLRRSGLKISQIPELVYEIICGAGK
jgi:hypothetical protein